MPTEAVARLLMAAVRRRVGLRGGSVGDTATLAARAAKVASAMTAATGTSFGIMLMGGTGTGKTTMARAMQDVLNALAMRGMIPGMTPLSDGLRLVHAKDVMRDGQADRLFTLLCDEPLLALDDLGCEPTEKLVFGNASTPVTDLLEHRYERRLFTVATTNLTASDIRQKYGARVADRCREMFTRITFNGNSYRQ